MLCEVTSGASMATPRRKAKSAVQAESRSGDSDPSKRNRMSLNLIISALEDAERKGKPPGTFIVINIDTGEYVISQSFMDANSAFIEQFPGARGFAHRLGEPIFEPLVFDR
jgi:hypothetical protein